MAQDITFWLPMGFVLSGVLLYLWEVSQPGFFIAVPATVLVLLGMIGLVWESFLFSFWAPILALVIALPTIAVTLRVYRKVAPPSERPETTIGDSLVGKNGTVTVAVHPDVTSGKVRIDGAIWSARTEGDPIDVGAKVTVVATSGVHVVVAPRATAPADAAPKEEEAGA